MLPVVAGVTNTRRQIVALHAADGRRGGRALGDGPDRRGSTASPRSRSALSSWCWRCAVLANKATEPKQMGPEKRLFAYSILYLFALFAALVVDRDGCSA